MIKSNKGFSLIEVLMVTALLAFIALSVFYAVRGMVNAKETVDENSEATQELRAVLGLMTRDIQTATFFKAEDLIWNPVTQKDPASGKNIAIPKPAPISIFNGKTNQIFFSSRSHQRLFANSPENSEHFVTYQLQGQELIRAESARAVNIYDREDPSRFKSTILLDRVSSLKFKFYDTKISKWMDSWDTENSTYKDRLPGAVEIEMSILPLVIEGTPGAKKEKEPLVLKTAVKITNISFSQGVGT